MLLERMERRELLANDFAAIAGFTFDDLNANGIRDVGEPVIPNVTVSLYRETNVNGVYDDSSSAQPDVLFGTLTSDAVTGEFRFDGLDGPDADNPGGLDFTKNPDGVGAYWLVQAPVAGRLTPAPILVNVTDDTGVQIQLIDDYKTTAITVTDSAGGGSTVVSGAAPEAIGGFRDIQVTNAAATGQVTVLIDGVPSTGVLAFGALGNANGTALIQYDGGGNGITLDSQGLETAGVGISLGGGLPGEAIDPDAGFVVRTNAESAGDNLTITVYSNGNSSSTTIPLSDAAGFTETFVRFTDFLPVVGVDFNDVGAIEASMTLATNNDVQVAIVETRRPNLTTMDIPNITPVTLGGTLFFDNSIGNQNDGIRQPSEAAINGVTVELYQLANADDTLDLATATPITSQTTSGTGNYSFTNLNPGHYAVAIPANQFQGAAVLSGFANSTGNDPAPDPDDDVDNDDNGTTVVSANPLINGAVISGTITLASNSEPINDGDTDPNTNNTLDFGFFPQIDLAITKEVNTIDSNVNPGGVAVFNFTVQNNGPRPATGVVVTDPFPAGLTPTGIQNASGAFTLATNGNTVTVTIGNIAASSAATFQLTANIAANQFTDLTNPASVTGNEVDIDLSNNSDSADLDLPQADLSITKTDLQDPVNAGDQLTYQIVVTNNGPDAAAGVVVTDTLPASVSFVSGNVDGNASLVSVDGTTGNIIANVGGLANQGSATITIVVDVDQDSPTPILNVATVTSNPNTDPNPDNNSTDEDTVINRAVDVAIDKTVTGSVVAGEVATYTVVVTNNGPSQASGVTVTDTLNAALSLVANSFDPGTSGVTIASVGQTSTFTVGVLDADESVSFSFDVLIDSSATGTIPNTATVTSTETDSVPANNTDTVNITVDQAIDLILTKVVDLATAVPGQDSLVYTFTVEHDTDSPSDASNVVITDTLPTGVSGAIINAPGSTQSNVTGGVVTVTYNSLPAGQSRTFTVTVDVDQDATGSIVNPASVTATQTELNNTNNSDSATTTLTPDFDVVVTKAVSDNTPDPLQTITYTIGVQNEGPSRATGVILSDPIPAGLTFVSGTLNGQAGTSNGTTVTFPAINLNSGQTANGTLTFTVNANATGTITNTASVPNMANAGENDVTNNSASVNVTVNDLVDLRISKTVNAANAQVGDTLVYTIRVDNDGPSAAQAVTVTDTLPAGVTFVSGVGPNSEALAVSNGIVTVNGGTLANAGFFTFTINATVAAAATVINTTSVSTTTNEIALANNTATASTNIDPMTSSIAGSVYIDTNNNGIREASENGIANVQIVLTGTDALGNNVSLNTTTNANGDYLFSGLAAGTYTIEEIQPAGFIDGIDTGGTGAGATAGDDIFTQLGLGQAAQAVDFNFGERLTSDPFSKRRFLASS